jgi:hypothetical protein
MCLVLGPVNTNWIITAGGHFCRLVILNKWLATTLGAKMAPALRVEAKKAPLCVARRLFGMTKLLSSRRD